MHFCATATPIQANKLSYLQSCVQHSKTSLQNDTLLRKLKFASLITIMKNNERHDDILCCKRASQSRGSTMVTSNSSWT